jgi:hypothetical protein
MVPAFMVSVVYCGYRYNFYELNLAACGGAFFRQARPGATSLANIAISILFISPGNTA